MCKMDFLKGPEGTGCHSCRLIFELPGACVSCSAYLPFLIVLALFVYQLPHIEQLKLSATSARLKGRVGMSILPGSTRVFDRGGNTLMECTPNLCPMADRVMRTDPVTRRRGWGLVNRVIYAAQPGYGAALNARASKGSMEVRGQIDPLARPYTFYLQSLQSTY